MVGYLVWLYGGIKNIVKGFLCAIRFDRHARGFFIFIPCSIIYALIMILLGDYYSVFNLRYIFPVIVIGLFFTMSYGMYLMET